MVAELEANPHGMIGPAEHTRIYQMVDGPNPDPSARAERCRRGRVSKVVHAEPELIATDYEPGRDDA